MTQKPYLEATTFSTMSKNHQLTTTQLNIIADDIHRATTRPRNETFVTRKQKQIDFMDHLYTQGYSQKEIGNLYGVSDAVVSQTLCKRYRKLKKR